MSKQKLSREEIAKIEIGHTTITKHQKIMTSVIFLAVIFIYPMIQFGYELWTREIKKPTDLQPLTIVPMLAGAKVPSDGQLNERVIEYNHAVTRAIKDYENTLEDTSALRYLFLPPAQQFMLDVLKTGNEKVIIGENQWLFYTSDFNYLVNPGFLRPERLQRRALSQIQPNPVAAIADFNNQLKKRDIELILLPIPVKPMLYADQLGGGNEVLQNYSWEKFKAEMAALNIRVLDIAPELMQMRRENIEPYLKTDTHWTPEGMKTAANLVAKALPGKHLTPAGRQVSVTALGDIAHMLTLSNPEQSFRPETVTVEEFDLVPNPNADVLLLGDSFINIYSFEAMHWGVHAGLAEHLAAYLGKPVDVIVRNDAGAYATRQLLSNELKRGRDRLNGKKTVIYEFAIRELADGDWKILDMTLGQAPEIRFLAPSKPMSVTATVLAVSAVPRPYSVPYKDHVMSVHLADINGGNDQAVVYLVSMSDNVLTKAAQLRPGEVVTLQLSPWKDYEAQFGSFNRSELADDQLLLQEPCFGKLTEEKSSI